jgi:hypothetical protein
VPQARPDVPQPLPDPIPTPTPAPEIIPETPNKLLPEIIPPAPDIAEPLHSSNIEPKLPTWERIVTTSSAPMHPPLNKEMHPASGNNDTVSNTMQTPEHSPMLVITSPYIEEPYEIVIDREEMTIGRAGSSDILLDFDPFTSRHHALLQKQDGQYFLYDRRSAYGISVNGQALSSDQGRLLQNGDQISIGQYKLLFSIGTTQKIYGRTSQNAQV